jgi:hypothetical protein
MLPIHAGPPGTELFNILLRIDVPSRAVQSKNKQKKMKFLPETSWAVMYAIMRFCSRCREAIPDRQELRIWVSPLATLLLTRLRP